MLTDLAKVIEEHRIEWDQGTGYDGCACSWRPKYPPVVAFEDHPAHVAEALESIVAAREQAAYRRALQDAADEIETESHDLTALTAWLRDRATAQDET